MKYLVTYDISDNRTRDSVSRTLSKYGVRVQLSCFEIECKEEELVELLEMINKKIDPLTDSVYFFPVTRNAERSICEIGSRREVDGKVI